MMETATPPNPKKTDASCAAKGWASQVSGGGVLVVLEGLFAPGSDRGGGFSVFRVRLSLWKPVLWHPPILRQAQLPLRLQSRRRRQDPEGEPGGGGGQDPENIDQVATARKRGTRNMSGTLLT